MTITLTRLQNQILNAYVHGLTPLQIVEKIGASRTYVDAVILRFGQPNTTEETIIKQRILDAHALGLTNEHIVEHVGVSQELVAATLLKHGLDAR